MDVDGQRGGRLRFNDYREEQLTWNVVNHCHSKEQNTLGINRQFLNLVAERDAAIEGRERALLERKKALEEREAAISQRNLAIKARNDAITERDNVLSALQQSKNHTLGSGVQSGTKKQAYIPEGHTDSANFPFDRGELQILDAFCRTVTSSECNNSPPAKRPKENKGKSSTAVKQKNGKRIGEDLNRLAAADQVKLRNNWDGQNLGLNRVDFDESIMPIPGCSCTGVFRQCYKWGNGGWQSSCCTTTMSVYPLPPVPNKRYARLGGRKMSGSAFSKLLTRLASEGFDLSLPVDLKYHWSKHGTNRYITIK